MRIRGVDYDLFNVDNQNVPLYVGLIRDALAVVMFIGGFLLLIAIVIGILDGITYLILGECKGL